MSDQVSSIQIDTAGITLPAHFVDNFDVYFDKQHVWSFAAAELPVRGDGTRKISWPRAMSNWLEGPSLISLRVGERELCATEVRFTDREGRVNFIDEYGIPVMIDKWGLIQRPFSGRDPAVVTQMLDITEQIIEIVREECGVQCWLAFGSLLGAAREGGVIAFDSDVDLAYLSDKTSPVELNLEMYDIARALRRRGLRVLSKSGAFVTVLFDAPDGAEGSVDIYSTFVFDGNLYETATVRSPVPASEIVPLRTIAFEGRQLPVPHNFERLLEESYGPNWRVPDPAFKHLPGPEITRRFDDWFGSLMKQRRDWERFVRRRPDEDLDRPTDFQVWVQQQIPADAEVFDLGAGLGNNSLAFARAGHAVVAADFTRFTFRRAATKAKEEKLTLRFISINLRSLRNTLSGMARVAHWMAKPRVLFAAGVIDALDNESRWNFQQLLKHFGRPGDQAFLEFSPGPLAKHDPWKGGRRTPVDLRQVLDWLHAAGLVVEVSQAGGPAIDGRPTHRIRARYAPRRAQ